jgi:heptose I phosphotransferase
MTHGSLLGRLVRGTRWTWIAEPHRAALPADLEATVMDLPSADRYHAKQGRSTARVRFDSTAGPLSVYLKRHESLPWSARLAALVDPAGRHTPASAEWHHLERVRALGVAVPEVVAAGERIGPWGHLQSFLMVAELTGCLPLNEAIPALRDIMTVRCFETLKRQVVAELAEIAATLHRARVFHKDFYLCHFFLDPTLMVPAGRRLTLIDLHRSAEHRRMPWRWRRKDLAQLLFSTAGVAGIEDRDRLRFWALYRRRLGLRFARWEARGVRAKANRYLAHNRPSAGGGPR